MLYGDVFALNSQFVTFVSFSQLLSSFVYHAPTSTKTHAYAYQHTHKHLLICVRVCGTPAHIHDTLNINHGSMM